MVLTMLKTSVGNASPWTP